MYASVEAQVHITSLNPVFYYPRKPFLYFLVPPPLSLSELSLFRIRVFCFPPQILLTFFSFPFFL
jgi:hypothetical protein